MSVSVTLPKSMARSLDAVSSITQHVAMIAADHRRQALGVIGFFEDFEVETGLRLRRKRAMPARFAPRGRLNRARRKCGRRSGPGQ